MDKNNKEIIANKQYSEQEEKVLAKKAQKRVSFKIHIIIYILANLLIWLLWFFIFSKMNDLEQRKLALNIFLFITLVWVIFVVAHYLFVYKWDKTYVEKEIDSLKKEQEKKQKELEQLKEEENKQQS
jgi:cell division protein FtsL